MADLQKWGQITMRTRNKATWLVIAGLALPLLGYAAYAAAPTAGSVIGNQAAATYVNSSGDTISVTSNMVQTVVQQVAGVTLATNASETAAPGGKAFLPHSITNDGNGPDAFTLAAADSNPAGGDFDFDSVLIYPDANQDGIADTTTTIASTPVLAPGETYGIIIEANIPSSAIATESETITISATSQYDGAVSDTNTDTITVSTGAIIEIAKSMTAAPGGDGIVGPGDTVTITLTYTNTGLTAATDLIVTDVLDGNLTFDAASGVWSDSATGLTDANDAYELTNGAGDQIDFQYDGTDTVTFQIDNVPTGRTGSVTFTATIDAGTGAGTIYNTATQTVNTVAFPPSNRANIVVEEVYQVTAADAASSTYSADPDTAVNLVAAPGSSTDDDGALNDQVEEDTDTYQGQTIRFEFVLTNQSNIADSMNVSVANGSFPAGTTFEILAADNATPVLGTVGPLASGGTTTVNVIARLAPSAAAAAAGTTNYTATLSAQSINGGTANTATALFTGAVLAATVDIENPDTSGDGPNPLNGGNPWIDYATDPGDPVSFDVVVQNNGPTGDTYNLSLGAALPTGWTITYALPSGALVTNTGVIAGGGSLTLTVTVTPTATAAPTDQSIDIVVTSPTTGQTDSLVNAVIVNEIVDLEISSSQAAQVAPGGTVDLPLTLRNHGNTTITEGAVSMGGTFSTFNAVLYHDVNGDGAVDAGDTVLDNIDDIAGGIAAGASEPIILRVQAPSAAAVGLVESDTVVVATSLNTGTDTDGSTGNNTIDITMTIVSGDITLLKEQALDANCDGTIGAFVTTQLTADPGQCIRYRITASNTGSANAGTVTIRDTVPAFTTFTECTAACAVAVTPGTASVTTQPPEGATGAIESAHGTLLPGQSATLLFTIQIDS